MEDEPIIIKVDMNTLAETTYADGTVATSFEAGLNGAAHAFLSEFSNVTVTPVDSGSGKGRSFGFSNWDGCAWKPQGPKHPWSN